MASVSSDNSRVGHNVSSLSLQKKWLLPREKLEAIAILLETLNQRFEFNYRSVTEDRLIELQECCFKTVFEMCEQEMWTSLQKIREVIQGLTDSSGNTVLSIYVQKDEVLKDDITKEKVKIKKIVNFGLARVLSNGSMPAHIAVILRKNLAYVKNLFSTGCGDRTDLDRKGRMAVHLAVKMGYTDVIYELLPKTNEVVVDVPYRANKLNLDIDSLSLAVLKGQIACFNELKKIRKVPLYSVRIGTECMTLLHFAIYANQFEVLQHLLTEYFEETKLLLNIANHQGYTPTILAAILNDVASLRLLIEKGANLEICDYRGWTAVHHAVYKKNGISLCTLAANGAKLTLIDLDGNTPLDLLDKEEVVFRNIIKNLIIEKAYQNSQVNFVLNPPENLVFKGGGPKAVAYLGAIKELERRDILIHVKRVAGTSAGAITAALLAVGCNSEETEKLLIETSGDYFLDHPFTKEGLTELVHDNLSIKFLKEISDTVSECVTNGSLDLKQIGLKLLNAIWKLTGICAGKKFLNWIENEIEQRTGISHCTFGELVDLIAKGKSNPQGRKFKHLHVYATKLCGHDTELDRFSSEDPSCKNLIISEAVRASMSIPIVFKPHILIFKQKIAEGEYEYYTSNRTYVSRDYAALLDILRRGEHIAEPSYIDGGLIYNFPIKAFDRRGYVQSGVMEEEKEYYQFNRKTLGFSLSSAEKERVKVNKVQTVETFGDLLLGVYTVFRQVESLIDKMDKDPRDKKRIITLDNQGISFLGFETTPILGKGAKAIDEAEKKTKEFFDNQANEIKGIVSQPIKQEEKKPQVNRPIKPPELHISEAEAKELLTLGPRACNYIYWCNASRGSATALNVINSIFIVTLPLTIPGLIYCHEEPKSLKSRKLELLSYDDDRFAFFEHLGEGEFEEAEAEFTKNHAFFKALMKTYVFVSTLKKCLLNCDNKFYHWDRKCNDPLRFRRYMYYLTETKIIPNLIPRDFVYDLPEL